MFTIGAGGVIGVPLPVFGSGRPPRGRKNYLCVHDGDTGASLAGSYSLVATCEARGVNPFEYLADVLARVQGQPTSAIDELLPGAWAGARDR
jgi:transposase